MNKALIVAALAVLAGGFPARANTGVLTCQISLSEFAADAYGSRGQLSASQMASVRQLVDIGRGQCRSSSQIVLENIQALRQSLNIGSDVQSARGFDYFWPAERKELAALQ